MRSLLVFESKTLTDQLVKEENALLVKRVLAYFADCVRQYIGHLNLPSWDGYYELYLEDSYLSLISEDFDGQDIIKTISDDGEAVDWRLRFRELMDVCVNAYKDDMVSTLRSFQSKSEIISTVNIVGYDKYKLSIMVISMEAPK
ncbi:hypothetical protein RVBP21_3120 [Pseudomonas phage BRkr]|nr:hypothetical protein RVBP21_3120 [Pseudomonas phage BRkr]